MAQSDDVLLVRPHAMLYDKQEFLSQLEPGMTLPARLVASDQKTLQTRFSPWIDLKTCPEAPHGAHQRFNSGLGSTTRSQDAESVISIGSQLILMHSSDDGGPFTMVASGLWNGPVLFSTKTEEAGFRYKLVRLNATGSFTIQNQTNGARRSCRAGWAAYDYNSPLRKLSAPSLRMTVIPPSSQMELGTYPRGDLALRPRLRQPRQSLLRTIRSRPQLHPSTRRQWTTIIC